MAHDTALLGTMAVGLGLAFVLGFTSVLLVTTREPFQTRALLETARADNPDIQTIVRTHTDDERSELERRGVDMVVVGENELALALARYGLVRMGWNEPDADATIDETDDATAWRARCPSRRCAWRPSDRHSAACS